LGIKPLNKTRIKRVVNQNLATKIKEKQPRLGKPGAVNKALLRLLD
tara:strand:+ start:732 stop:869 length:138 start_codon:yes stop_codon:yes gene_type:complete